MNCGLKYLGRWGSLTEDNDSPVDPCPKIGEYS
jgi:hypothetical protein